MEETIPELVKLKKEGLVRQIGITGLPLPIFKNVLDRYPFLDLRMFLIGGGFNTDAQDDTCILQNMQEALKE